MKGPGIPGESGWYSGANQASPLCGGGAFILPAKHIFKECAIGMEKMLRELRERVLNNLWNIEPNLTSAVASQAEVNTGSQEGDEGALEENSPSAPAEQGTENEAAEAELSDASASAFISRFRGFVESRMTNSELSIEDLASDMNLSRVQLYRKVKAITGSSPVELLRTARLNRGYQLLLTTDKTVSEVAYAVGFSAPAYFTKCFKDEFGMVPGDVRK